MGLYWENLEAEGQPLNEALGCPSNLLSSCGERYGGQGIAGNILEYAPGEGPLIPFTTFFWQM